MIAGGFAYGLGLGAFLGACAGFVVAALLAAAHRGDEER